MYSIKKRLSLILIFCTIFAVILSAAFVNLAMNKTFSKYVTDVQDNRNNRIIEYFQEVYKKEGKWNSASGKEIMHEAFMNNYCITLTDESNQEIWGMDPNDIKNNAINHKMMGYGMGKGIYTSKTFNINANGKTVGYVTIGQYYPVMLTEQDVNFKNAINRGIVLSAFIVILITILISLRISKQFSYPIKKVSDTSVELSQGNYEAGNDIKSNIVEISSLIKSINALGEKLKNQDIIRKRLISDISHEIRTPLNILQNNLEAMIDGIVPVTPERLEGLNDEVIRFGKLLNNLDSLKKFEAEGMNMGMVSLKNLLSDICDDFKGVADEKNIKIDFIFDSNNYNILGDEDKLKQVFINLISNAVKFNNENGRVVVSLSETEDKVIAIVDDNGKGIAKEDLPYIFERLYRGDKSRHEIQGSGIGLAIVKRILLMHSAVINVDSQLGKGTKFTISFYKEKN